MSASDPDPQEANPPATDWLLSSKAPSLLTTLINWLDERTRIRGVLHSLLNWPVPHYVQWNFLYSLGGLTLFSILVQFATGILLGFYYDPSVADAYNSVDFVTYRVPLGWLIRGIHFYNASAIIILVVLHLVRTFTFGAYQKPREITWLSGVVLLLIVLGAAFTGYVLPWDQQGYWSTKVSIEILAKVPLLGHTAASIMSGGAHLGQLTLTRYFVIHTMLLPLSLMLLIVLHIVQHRAHGVAPSVLPWHYKVPRRNVPYYPNWVIADALLGLGLLLFLGYFSWQWRAPLEFPADPTSTVFDPRPDWYFLFLYELLQYTHPAIEPLVAVGLPFIVFGSLLLLPFVDRGGERRVWRKPLILAVALVYLAVVVIFTLLAL